MASDPAPQTAPASASVTPGKATKEKKPKVPKERKPRATKVAKPAAAHPTYLQMIVEAISALKERTGSSQQAIAKFIEDKYKTGLPSNFKKLLSGQLKKLTQKGKLVQVKHSYKLSESLKKPAKPAKKPGVSGKVKKVGRPKSVKSKVPKSPKAKVAKSAKPKVAKAAKPAKASKAASTPKKSAPKKVTVKKSAPKKSKTPKKVAPKKPKSVKKTPAPKKAKTAA